MQDPIKQCEHEVEAARAKLAGDLAVLRSPKTFAAFTDDIKHDAIGTKDELVGQAKDAVTSQVTGIVEDLKAKAAANPAAALMIGAGVGWYLLRHPPITTALVGCGLFSLLRTKASAQPFARTSDYMRQGQARLKEQASAAVSQVMETASTMATDAGAKISAKSSELLETAKDKSSELLDTAKHKSGELLDAAQATATRLSHDTRDQVAAGASAVQEQVSAVMAKAGGAASSLSGQARDAGASASRQMAQTFDDTLVAAKAALPDADARDRVLLSVAGLAVAAAFGIACQKRIAEKV